MNKSKLLKEALVKYLGGLILVGLLLFVPASSLGYKYGWIFMLLLFVPMLIAGVIMFSKTPKLLEKRLNAKEKQSEQKKVINASGLIFFAVFIVSGLNYRFGWNLLTAHPTNTLKYLFYGTFKCQKQSQYLHYDVKSLSTT